MTDKLTRVPEPKARALWERAIELQQSAERKPGTRRQFAAPDAGGYTLEQIVASAEDAGVDSEFIRLAVAEARLPHGDSGNPGHWTARVMRRVTGAPDALEVTGTIGAPPDRAIPAFQRVLSQPEYRLVLADRVGPDPPLEGVLVYRIDTPAFGGGSFHGAMTVADAKILFVTAREDGGRTVLQFRLPHFEHGANLVLTGLFSAGLGTTGAYGGTAAGTSLAGLLGTASVAAMAGPAAAGAVIGGALGVAGFRSLNRWGRRKGRTALQQLLHAVQLEADTPSSGG